MTLQYRGDGRLYARTDASTSVRYRYDAGWNPLVETDASNHLRIVWFWGTLGVFETVAGVETLLASFPYASMTMDSRQTLAVQVRNDKLAVYHAPRGKAPRLLGGDIAVSTTMNTNALRLGVSGQSGFRFDSVSVHARALDAAKSTTYAYNTSNQLTSSVTNGTTTTYTYDAWGRLLTRTAGTASASYAYRGDKLKQVTSTFPGEASTVAMNYDGLGRRRNRMANGVSPITWWRWGIGNDTFLEYNDSDMDWNIEGFAKFSPVLASIYPLAEASVPQGGLSQNATYSYISLDKSRSTRSVYSQARTQTAAMEFYPFGERLSTSGTLPYHQLSASGYDGGSGLNLFKSGVYSAQMEKRYTGGSADSSEIISHYFPGIGGCPVLVDMLVHYFGASGLPFDLNQRGYIDDLRSEKQIQDLEKNWRSQVDFQVRDIVRQRCQNSNSIVYGDFFFNGRGTYAFVSFPENWYALGVGFLWERALGKYVADCCNREYMYQAALEYRIIDMFDEALKPFGAERDIPFVSSPYLILGFWKDVMLGSGRF